MKVRQVLIDNAVYIVSISELKKIETLAQIYNKAQTEKEINSSIDKYNSFLKHIKSSRENTLYVVGTYFTMI